MKTALIIGYGSIGQRHFRILTEMGMKVDVVSKSKIKDTRTYHHLEDALVARHYDYIVISNETSLHYETLKIVSDLQPHSTVLIEKPLFAKKENIELHATAAYVAYNLRFHPLIETLKGMLSDEEVLSVNAYAGQYLPSWRPNRDYKTCYSSHRHLGGGVVRDLSHELDYLTNIFGEWKELIAYGGKISNLNINSEDYCTVNFITSENISVLLELNYLDRINQRYMTIQTNASTIKVDFITSIINHNGVIHSIGQPDRDFTYRKQHEDIIAGSKLACTYDQGVRIIDMIEAIEKSIGKREWVHRG